MSTEEKSATKMLKIVIDIALEHCFLLATQHKCSWKRAEYVTPKWTTLAYYFELKLLRKKMVQEGCSPPLSLQTQGTNLPQWKVPFLYHELKRFLIIRDKEFEADVCANKAYYYFTKLLPPSSNFLSCQFITDLLCLYVKVPQAVSFGHFEPHIFTYEIGLPWWLSGKEFACLAGDPGSISGLVRAPGEGHGNPLKYSCLENSMDIGAWWSIVHRVSQNVTWLKRLSNRSSMYEIKISFSCFLKITNYWAQS